MEQEKYVEHLHKIKGKTIGIVYVYESNVSPNRKHYDAWQGDVLADWVHAVYELSGLPLVMDVRTFVEKVTNGTLPPIDFVVNLSNGYYDLSALGLIPSLCAYHSIPCIPCNASLLLVGENKPLSNLIAEMHGFQIPKILNHQTATSITRPNNLGSSRGVYRGKQRIKPMEAFVQEFIPGFDTTIPVLFNPLDEICTVLPAVGYIPDNMDPQWFLGEQQKDSHSGYKKQVLSVDSSTKQAILDFVQAIGITTYCRIDFRAFCTSNTQIKTMFENGITLNDLRFIEINPLPTIKDGINFFTALHGISASSSIAHCLDLYRCNVRDGTLTGFVLSCSIFGIKAKH